MTPIKLEYPTIEKEDPPEPNMKIKKNLNPQPVKLQSYALIEDWRELIIKKCTWKDYIQEKIKQVKFTKSEEYTQPSVKPEVFIIFSVATSYKDTQYSKR